MEDLTGAVPLFLTAPTFSQYLWLGLIFQPVCISLKCWFPGNEPKLFVTVNSPYLYSLFLNLAHSKVKMHFRVESKYAASPLEWIFPLQSRQEADGLL